MHWGVNGNLPSLRWLPLEERFSHRSPCFTQQVLAAPYWVWMIILFAFVIQAVAYEFRTKPGNFLGQRTYEVFMIINGALGTILVGAAVGTFFTGSEFSVNKMNLTNLLAGGSTTISSWEGPAYGLEAALNIQNLSLGLAVFFLARVLGILYFMNSIDNDQIFGRGKKHLLYNAVPFLVFFLLFVGLLLTKDGFAVIPDAARDPILWKIQMEPYKYLNNYLQMPLVLIMFLVGVVLVLWGITGSLLKDSSKGIWFAGAGTVLTVFRFLWLPVSTIRRFILPPTICKVRSPS